MLVVTCPNCRSSVLQNADGTCPACGKVIPPEAAKPLVVHSTFAGAGTSTDGSPVGKRPTMQWTPAGRGAGPVYATQEHPGVKFGNQLLKNTPSLYATKAMVFINAAVFLLMVLAGVSMMAPSAEALISWGANFGPMTLSGQWWRLLTCMFLHGGLLHVGMNMWVLWNNGELLERLTGNIGFIILYLFSGLFGSLASIYWNPVVCSVGASGAVFGVFGGIMGFLVLRRDSVPKSLLTSLRKLGFFLLIYVVVTSVAMPFIDNAAHVGGFVAGLIFGMIMSHPLEKVTARTRRIRNLAAIAAGMLGLAAGIWAAPAVPAFHAEATKLDDLESQYEEAARLSESGLLTDEEFAEEIESQILPAWIDVKGQYESVDIDTLPDAQRRHLAANVERLNQGERRFRENALALRELAKLDAFKQTAIGHWNDAVRKARGRELANGQLAEYAETGILPEWKKVRARFDQLNFDNLPDATKWRAEKEREYLTLREQAWENYLVAVKVEDPDMLEKYHQDTAAAEAIAAELRAR